MPSRFEELTQLRGINSTEHMVGSLQTHAGSTNCMYLWGVKRYRILTSSFLKETFDFSLQMLLFLFFWTQKKKKKDNSKIVDLKMA